MPLWQRAATGAATGVGCGGAVLRIMGAGADYLFGVKTWSCRQGRRAQWFPIGHRHLGGVIVMPLAKPRFAALGDAHLIEKEDIRNEGKFDGVDQRFVGKIAGQHSLWTWCAALKGLPGN
ncbi:hypothetical protein IW261DRAFT_1425995 [Armillaria novae-zelandiae]|uniref:Uncharacterized protein n=1 Tax=Armillaria novae-zelandiae TaxID=153914 RepID=A0AA39TX20_9AGAR|nr:hypothetical protein IW261DRAFT_1425995 [Armillaria novae-zelandiae]